MTKSEDIRETILDLASEDFYGLWEVCWKARETFDGTDRELLSAVADELDSLARAGEVEFYVRESAMDEPRLVKPDDVDWRSALTLGQPEGELHVLIAASDREVR